jgi:predicted nucleic acid-binding protein
MIALDSNLLIYAHRAAVPEHGPAQRAIEQAARSKAGWAIPFPCIAEFWMVVTHPSSLGGASQPREARAFLAGLFTAGAKPLYARPGWVERLSETAVMQNVTGPRIFDLQIALTAFEGGATELWTHDRCFITLPGLSLRDPLVPVA